MPPTRAIRQRAINNENDENNSTRLTRAKAAALTTDDISGAMQKPLQSKKGAVNTTAQGLGRKRAALGDVSNVTKGDAVDGKKGLGGKAGFVSKAAQPTGIQKSTVSRTNSSRTTLGSKDANKKSATTSTKRSGSSASGSGAGSLGAVTKKRQPIAGTSTTVSVQKEEIITEENASLKKVTTVELERKSKVDESKENEVDNKQVEKETMVQEVSELISELVPDLDREDIDDPLMVSEYVVEIFEYLHDLEVTSMPNPDYMDHQEDLEWKMRGILVDWLIEVHMRFHLLPETLFLAINIIDRFLSAKVVQLDRLQLVGVTAMFIASKYEEVLSPHVAAFRHVADDGFTDSEILSAERFVLSALDYDLSYPNPMNFLRRISKADNYDIHTRTLGKYLMEVSLVDHRFMSFLPSHIAAASMYLARMIINQGDASWDATITHYSGYSEEQIQPVFKLLIDHLARPVIHDAFFKKYASKKFMKVALLTREWAKANAVAFGVDITTPRD